jgi:hypothetical protein
MDQYIRRPISDSERFNLGFLEEWPISELFSVGGFVAGGAVVQAVFSGEVLADRYLRTSNSLRGGGDIDFFFPDEESHNRGRSLVNVRQDISTTGINTAWTAWTHPQKYKLQLISARYSGTPEEVMNRFDFANCKAAFDGRELIYHRDLPQLEATSTLRMDRSSGYVLAWRMVRYLTKGYRNVHPATHEHIVDWFIRVRTGEWELDDTGKKGFNYTFRQIQDFLKDPRSVRDEDLILAVGFMRMVAEQPLSSSYDPTEPLVVDVAREELRKRLGHDRLMIPGDGEGQ